MSHLKNLRTNKHMPHPMRLKYLLESTILQLKKLTIAGLIKKELYTKWFNVFIVLSMQHPLTPTRVFITNSLKQSITTTRHYHFCNIKKDKLRKILPRRIDDLW